MHRKRARVPRQTVPGRWRAVIPYLDGLFWTWLIGEVLGREVECESSEIDCNAVVRHKHRRGERVVKVGTHHVAWWRLIRVLRGNGTKVSPPLKGRPCASQSDLGRLLRACGEKVPGRRDTLWMEMSASSSCRLLGAVVRK